MQTTEAASDDAPVRADNLSLDPHLDLNRRPAKRKRVALACEPCRERKVKCDGAKPICRVCEKRADLRIQCIYTLIPQTAKQISEQEYVASLRKQIQDLQHTVRDATSQNGNTNVSTSDEASVAQVDHHHTDTDRDTAWVNNTPHQQQQRNSGQRRTTASPLGVIRSPATQRTSKPSPVSAMGASIVDRDTTPRTSEMYGQSSVHSLLQEVSHASRGPVSQDSLDRSRSRQRRPAAHPSSVMVGPQYALPPRQVADDLLRLYFTNVHIFYPYTHSISFQRRYESLWTKDGYPGPPLGHGHGHVEDIGLGGDLSPPSAFFCALNAMFALGCEFSNMSEREEASAMFRHRMQDLLHADLMDYSSIAHVQVLLLAGHYLLTTEHPTRCYNIVGLACRIAVALGLHSSPPSSRFSVLEHEIRRRAWYACLQLEMTVCMTLGRPPLLQVTDDVPLPMAIDDQHLIPGESVCQQPPDITSQNLFMVENFKLAKVLALILGYIYGADIQAPLAQHTRLAAPLDDGMSALLHLDATLEKLEASLPDALDWKLGPSQGYCAISNTLQRQRNVLRARFLHLRILLYRPSFSLYCSSLRRSQSHADPSAPSTEVSAAAQGDGTLTSTIRERCAKSCVQIACKLAKAIELATMQDATGAWWFGVFYLITCGGIVILAECAQLSGSHFDQTELDTTWESCIVTLQELGKYHSRAESYVQHLRSLRERALSDYVSVQASRLPSRLPSRVASRRSSAEPGLGHSHGEYSSQYAESNHMGTAVPGGEVGYATLLDSWEYNLDNGGFMFDQDMSFHFPTYLFPS